MIPIEDKKSKICRECETNIVHSKDLCRNCYNKYLLSVNPDYKERQKKNTRAYYLKNRERLTQYYRERGKKRSLDPIYKEKIKNRRLQREYGISLSFFRELLCFQKNQCAICEQKVEETDKFLHIDHCHETGKVRGLLCSQCNWFMSKIDSIKNCQKNLNNYIKNKGVKWKKLEDITKVS